ncbi:Acetyl-CoA acetyltransferase B, mitochondrial [Orchesella cincta]|uniref:Acetyl-CoA acetyltransferase B, mitochondrial n=1 Tax=Orchesella cincta TaxID=48709 RepID=A0A1D2NBA9_ORCCI|nr:Acetyl-CoA acetyltransferase B, mitochondrial [Orchesella cincta]
MESMSNIAFLFKAVDTLDMAGVKLAPTNKFTLVHVQKGLAKKMKINTRASKTRVKGKKDLDFLVDEEYKNIDLKDLPKLPTIFKDDGGNDNCGNSSSFNDGAAAVVLATESAAKTVKTKPLVRIVGFQDAGDDQWNFVLPTVHAIPKLLEKHEVKKEDVALWEIS